MIRRLNSNSHIDHSDHLTTNSSSYHLETSHRRFKHCYVISVFLKSVFLGCLMLFPRNYWLRINYILNLRHRHNLSLTRPAVSSRGGYPNSSERRKSSLEVIVNVGETGEITLTIDDDLGDIQLGKLSEEYILDPDLREILTSFDLDTNKMSCLQGHELRLVTSVVCSESFEVEGNRKHEVVTFYCRIFLFGADIFIYVDLTFCFDSTSSPGSTHQEDPGDEVGFDLPFLFALSIFGFLFSCNIKCDYCI